MARMMANKQTVAFANQSKVAERISNSDMSLYIDAVKKDFVIKYSNKTMKINAKERTFSDLEELIFAYYRGTIRGIADTARYDSTYALSAKYAYIKKQEMAAMIQYWDPITTAYYEDIEPNIHGVTCDERHQHARQHLLTYDHWHDHKESGGDGCDCGDKYALKEHTHVSDDITNLAAELETKADKQYQHNCSDITDIALNYAPLVHQHYCADILDIAINYARAQHTHLKADIIDLDLTKYQSIDDVKKWIKEATKESV